MRGRLRRLAWRGRGLLRGRPSGRARLRGQRALLVLRFARRRGAAEGARRLRLRPARLWRLAQPSESARAASRSAVSRSAGRAASRCHASQRALNCGVLLNGGSGPGEVLGAAVADGGGRLGSEERGFGLRREELAGRLRDLLNALGALRRQAGEASDARFNVEDLLAPVAPSACVRGDVRLLARRLRFGGPEAAQGGFERLGAPLRRGGGFVRAASARSAASRCSQAACSSAGIRSASKA